MKELWHTTRTPAYASNPANAEQMWSLSRAVIAEALEKGA